MTSIPRRSRIRTFSGGLWRRVIGRRSCIERLVRPRVALVLARRPPSSEPAAAPVGRTVRNEFRLALSLDFSWPTWLVDARSWRLDVQPIASAVSRRRGAPPLALVARRAEVQPMAMADVSRRSAAAGERPPSLRPVRPHDAAVAPAIDRRTSVETTLRDVITRLRTSRAASVLVSRGPLVTPSAGLAAHRAAADRVARVRTPHAVDRTPRRDASGTPVAGPSSATLINRTVTRSENKTEVVHHRTSFEQPVSKV
ncbi:MAG TPA: hypothetical protein VFO19_23200, partial [Vicinamibacterales bacterium]|nr:hypothetical protein [Vicinamibacterales bacterium]